ncbi:unnamed protein product [Orchesella dallaii]|uniref:TRAF-type domain-containing protein n=1 Tax=Orchesella dallaii TaxID=48710 RepID=A0ABP1RW14_9HEXA
MKDERTKEATYASSSDSCQACPICHELWACNVLKEANVNGRCNIVKKKLCFNCLRDVQPSMCQLEVIMFGSACSAYCAQYVEHRNSMGHGAERCPKSTRAIAEQDSCDCFREACQLVNVVTDVHRLSGSTSDGCVESCVPR